MTGRGNTSQAYERPGRALSGKAGGQTAGDSPAAAEQTPMGRLDAPAEHPRVRRGTVRRAVSGQARSTRHPMTVSGQAGIDPTPAARRVPRKLGDGLTLSTLDRRRRVPATSTGQRPKRVPSQADPHRGTPGDASSLSGGHPAGPEPFHVKRHRFGTCRLPGHRCESPPGGGPGRDSAPASVERYPCLEPPGGRQARVSSAPDSTPARSQRSAVAAVRDGTKRGRAALVGQRAGTTWRSWRSSARRQPDHREHLRSMSDPGCRSQLAVGRAVAPV